jgi:HEPN domain-containing protein
LTKQEYIDYWHNEAEKNWETANWLLKGKQYQMLLFVWHLVIEKLLKAHWTNNNESTNPPRTHNLVILLRETKLEIPEEYELLLPVINAWNIEGRYPDYKQNLFEKTTESYILQKMNQITELKQWLIQELPGK